MNNSNEFDVLSMAKSYAKAANISVDEIFDNQEKSDVVSTNNTSSASESTPNGWTPDPSLLEGMDEFKPAIYNKDEIRVESDDHTLKNVSDDNALQDKTETMDEMSRKLTNIELVKKERGYIILQIPDGEYQARIFAAAGDTDTKRAQKNINLIFDEIEKEHPEYIARRITDQTSEAVETVETVDKPIVDQKIDAPDSNNSDIKIVIDKQNVPNISWDHDEIDKIRRSRTVELNIIERQPLEMGNIADADTNMVDEILSKYEHTMGGIDVTLPASRYRATIYGLSYAELIDLMTSTEINSLDAERKKLSICFDHIKNPSIGAWQEYKWYIDKETGKKVQLKLTEPTPENIDPNDIHIVTKFDDFLMKTSYFDIDYIIWQIICATAMGSEIISVTCHATHDQKVCNNTYDWVYNPYDLLDKDKVQQVVLDEIEKTAIANTSKDIMDNFNDGLINANNYVKLKSSGMICTFGHISAYDYLTDIYGIGEKLSTMIDNEDPQSVSAAYTMSMLRAIKSFLIESNGKYIRIKGAENIVKVIDSLDEIDWQSLYEITNMVTTPYELSFSFKNVKCPKCHEVTNIPIKNIIDLLFIVAQNLSSVQVVFKKN